MITLIQYFGGKPHTAQHEADATDMLHRVNNLIDEAESHDFKVRIDADTGTQISGSKNGFGDGGFRVPTATTGATNSSHKQAKAVDVYDPMNWLDTWLSTFDYNHGENNHLLEKFGLYREHPIATEHWCHMTTRPPSSGRRTFFP